MAACNRLKGGNLPTEKLKEQLHKIASSRTGGLKTDEALGKTGAGPEGLPHSIIVTAEGIEGETEMAQQTPGSPAAAAKTAEAEPITETKNPVKAKRGSKETPKVGKGKSVGATKAKVGQQALFADEQPSTKQSAPLKKKPAQVSATRKRK